MKLSTEDYDWDAGVNDLKIKINGPVTVMVDGIIFKSVDFGEIILEGKL